MWKLRHANVEVLFSKSDMYQKRYYLKYVYYVRKIKINENCYGETYRPKKSWDGIRFCKSDSIYVLPRKAVPLFYFNTVKETKSEKSFWRFASRWCLPKEKGRERRRKKERKKESERPYREHIITYSRQGRKRIWRVECESCLIRRVARN